MKNQTFLIAVTLPPVEVDPTLIIRVSPSTIFLTLSAFVPVESDFTPTNLLSKKNLISSLR